MYAHLKNKRATPMVVTGYRLRNKIKFEYGKIIIDAMCEFPENSPLGKLTLCIYRSDKPTIPPDRNEALYLNKILPERDISHILALFGVTEPDNVYESCRRTSVEAPTARGRRSRERYVLFFSQLVDNLWLQSHGSLFGYKNAR